MPEAPRQVVKRAIMQRELRSVHALGEAGRDDPELLPEAAELLGELRFGVGLRHGVGEAGVEDGQVPREGQILGGAIQEALQEPDLVGLGPYPVELEGRRGGGDRVGVGIRVGGFALDGELGRGRVGVGGMN